MALLKMARLAPAVPVDELLASIRKLEATGAGSVAADSRAPWRPAASSSPRQPAESTRGSAPKAPGGVRPGLSSPEAAAPAASARREPSATPEPRRTGDEWADFVGLVKQAKPRLGSWLDYGSPLAVTAERLEIGFPEDSFALRGMRDPEALAALKELALRFFGREPTLCLTPLRGEAPVAPPNLLEQKRAEDERLQSDLRQAAESHPAVSATLDLFGGRIAEVVALAEKEPA